MNSLLLSKIWHLVTICIDLVQNRPNSLWQTEYHSYLFKKDAKVSAQYYNAYKDFAYNDLQIALINATLLMMDFTYNKLYLQWTCKNFTCKNFTCRNFTCKNFTCKNFNCKNFICKNFTCKNFTCKWLYS